jgi:anti-sigma regulatory factor (Ser/Thr protein kinase)
MTPLHQAVSCRCATKHDIVLARQAVRRLAQEQGFSLVDQTKIVTAASELARNALIYGGGGKMKWEVLLDGSKARRAPVLRGSRAPAYPISIWR